MELSSARAAPKLRTAPWLIATLVLLSLSVCINYVDRGNLSIAAPIIKNELRLSATQLGFLLTAFFVTYTPMQFVVGWLVDRYDAGRVLLAGYVLWSLATIGTGFAQGFAGLIALRLLLGVGESVAFPTYGKIIARWFPEHRRGIANAAIYTGMAIGPAVGIFMGGFLIAAYGWRIFFISFGLATLVWVIPWLAIAQRRLADAPSSTALPTPWRAIWSERSLWGASLGQFMANYVWYFTLTWIPYYLVTERHWSLQQMAAIGGAGYLLMGASTTVSGALEDRWIQAGASPTLVRKTFVCLGALAVAVFFLFCALSDARTSAIFFLFACVAMGMVSLNLLAIAQTIAGTTAIGRWVGIQNGLGNVAGIIAPTITGILVDKTGGFLAPFAVAAGGALIGALAWLLLVGPVVEIDWSKYR